MKKVIQLAGFDPWKSYAEGAEWTRSYRNQDFEFSHEGALAACAANAVGILQQADAVQGLLRAAGLRSIEVFEAGGASSDPEPYRSLWRDCWQDFEVLENLADSLLRQPPESGEVARGLETLRVQAVQLEKMAPVLRAFTDG